MATISGIQLSSQIIENTSWPLDAKMMLPTSIRLSLSNVQRWVWMLCYDTDLDVYKQLVNEPWTTDTEESDWVTFADWTSSSNKTLKKEYTEIDDTNDTQTVFELSESSWVIYWVHINWLWQIEDLHYNLNDDKNAITIDDNTIIIWDIICLEYSI